MSEMSIDDLITLTKTRTEALFARYLNHSDSVLLQEAMRYAVTQGGKKMRPLLVYATGLALGASYENLDAGAAAIELIHAYSLIHDDLPAMDNADMRRGRPSCHKAFNEAIAILAGDALQPLAFQIIASHPAALDDTQRITMIKILSQASGMHGMVAGQALDMQTPHDIETLITMHELKTSALIQAAIQLGIIAANHHDNTLTFALSVFGQKLGLAFQIQDDIFDAESTSETLGKPQGLDQTNRKITFYTLLGKEAAKQKANTLFLEAYKELEILGQQAKYLKEVTDYIIKRNK